jgi:transposase
MMGERLVRQDRLFYEICLEDKVPPDHLVRRIDAVLELSWLRTELAPYYSHTGCPSVDPELMIRMLLLGYCYSIRSDRRLCQEVDMNFAYRWFCGLGLEGRVPDHSTFSVNRHGRFRDSDILRQVFESVVHQCMEAGLVKGEGFAVDASVIEADASRFKRVEGSEIDWTDAQRARRPVHEYLTALDGENAPTNPARAPKALSPTDPCAAWTKRGRHKVMFGYSLNYLIDTQEAVIVDVEATPTRISKEVDAAETMVERTEECFDGGDAGLAGRAQDRAAHPGVGQSQARGRKPFTRRLLLRQGARCLCLPAGQAPQDHGTVARWQDTALPVEQARLRTLSLEAPMLSDHTVPQGPARYQRRGPRLCSFPDGNRGLSPVRARTQEDRDLIRRCEAEPGAHAAQTARPDRGTGRVPAGGDGSKPQTPG